MRPQVLKLGSVSPTARRWSVLAIVVLTLGLRVLEARDATIGLQDATAAAAAVQSAPDLLAVLASDEITWTASPLVSLLQAIDRSLGAQGRLWLVVQLGASLWIALLLLRFTRWLDFAASVTGAAFWSTLALAVWMLGGSGPGLLVALAQLLYLDYLRAFARRRDPGRAWRLGLRAGALSWVGGVGVLWLVATLIWLPFASGRFRSWGGLRTALVVAVVWAATLSPVLVRNLVVVGDAIPPYAHVPTEIEAGAEQGHLRIRVDGGPDAEEAGLTEPRAALRALSREGGSGWQTVGRRAIAYLGGWHPPSGATALPLLPWDLLVVVSWLGILALVPSLRAFLPLYLGVGLPAAQAAFTGLDRDALVVAAPVFCLFAGYGLRRWWSGRSWAPTWLLAPAALLLAFLLRWHVAGWS